MPITSSLPVILPSAVHSLGKVSLRLDEAVQCKATNSNRRRDTTKMATARERLVGALRALLSRKH